MKNHTGFYNVPKKIATHRNITKSDKQYIQKEHARAASKAELNKERKGKRV